MANNKKNIKIRMNKRGATGFRPFLISLAIVLVFTLFIFLFITSFLEVNNPNSELLNESYELGSISTSLQSDLNNFTETVSSAQDKLSNSNPSPIEFVFLIFSNAFWIPIEFLAMSGSFINRLFTGIFPLFFGNTGLGEGTDLAFSIIITTIAASLILTIVVLIIKYIRTGESER